MSIVMNFRRHFVAALAAGMIASGGLGVQAYAETKSDELVIAKSIANIVTLDPATNFELVGYEIINNVYDRLMMNEAGDLTSLVPSVAESYDLSEDGKTITFIIRPGQQFHSGNPLTAEDAVFSLQRVIKLNEGPAYVLSQFGWTPENVDELVKATGDMSLSLEITSDLGAGLLLNALSVFGIVDKTEVMTHEKDGDLGNSWLQTNTAGSGPYLLRTWRANELVILDANPNHRYGEPEMKRVFVRHIPETATQRLLLEKGDVDMAIDLTSDQLSALSGNDGVKIIRYPTSRLLYLAVNTRNEFLGNANVQQAMRYLIDYEGMASSFLSGKVAIHQAIWPNGSWGTLTETPFTYDVDRAKSLLAEAGYEDGFSLEFHTLSDSPYPEIAQAMQESFSKANINLEIIPAEGRVHWPKLNANKFDLAQGRWAPDFNDPFSNVDPFVGTPLADQMGWANEELQAMSSQAAVETDVEKRLEMYLDIQRRLQAEAPFSVMYQLVAAIAMQDDVQGFVRGSLPSMIYYRLVTKTGN